MSGLVHFEMSGARELMTLLGSSKDSLFCRKNVDESAIFDYVRFLILEFGACDAGKLVRGAKFLRTGNRRRYA